MPHLTALLAGILLGGPALLLWIYTLSLLGSLTGSDAAGNGMTQGFAVLGTILLWVLLGLFTLAASIGGQVPPLGLVAALLLIPVSGVAAGAAFQLLIRPKAPPYLWPLLIPALVPPLVLLFDVWGLLPMLRATLPPGPLTGAIWGLVLAASLAILPLRRSRAQFDAAAAEAAAQAAAGLAALPADAPAWALLPFLRERGTGALDNDVRERLRALASRQEDIGALLERGEFPFAKLSLPMLDLAPTPALCAAAGRALAQRAAGLSVAPAGRSYRSIAWEADGAIASLEWLSANGCTCTAEIRAWQAVLRRYPDVGWDSHRLAALLPP